jgi:Zn-dependent protease
MFWLVAALMGYSDGQPIHKLLIWIACMFVSILVHELGHVLMGMIFGTRGYIVLYSFGGLAVGSNQLADWWKRVAVSFAGPLAGFVFLAVILLGLRLGAPAHFEKFLRVGGALVGIRVPLDMDTALEIQAHPLPPLLEETILVLLFINLFWGLINLLPVWPLDGGQISRDFLSFLLPRRGIQLSLGISFLVAALLAINALFAWRGIVLIPYIGGGLWMAILFGMLAFQSFQLLQQRFHHDPRDPWLGQGRPWERNDQWWKR